MTPPMIQPTALSQSPTPLARTLAQSPALPLAQRLWPVALAALMGLLLLFGVGLAQPLLLHNATHDTRHATGFPCH